MLLTPFLLFLCIAWARKPEGVVIPQFDCPSLPAAPPATNVTGLRPADIKVVMALGDSISAGFAMKGLPAEYRGLVFSIGGDKYVSDFGNELARTIPNFLMHYNPNLQGQSTGESIPLTQGTYLNGAISGAKIQGVPGQIDYLVQTAQTTYKDKIDWENDWKLLTLFIGANNLCASCKGDAGTPELFEQELDLVLAKIQKEIPKVFVNVVTIFNISGVWNAHSTKEYCQVIWVDLGVDECPCLIAHGPEGRQTMDDNAVAYDAISRKLANKYSSKTTGNNTFNVVVQPGLTGFNITHWGEGFLSDLDCFHPNLLADEAFAIAIWNNMFQPVGQKSTNLDPSNVEIFCPTINSVLQ
eukprot:TRINITY_DN3831_c0_g1_i1.p1 TRINITY_DN3831_c0_g1~~TRINITY_DN3831_c0_g1_i1.p1  ORF type:complete len:355 (-),score=89.42 TRINITY_DN3831_c0_g1_i1:44-1108(-)